MRRKKSRLSGNRARSAQSRRAVIDEASEKALDELENLPESRWEALIRRIVLESAETGREVLSVPASDRARYESPFAGGASMLERLNAALEEKGLPGGLTLSDVPAKIRGGVLLSGEKYDVNGSFEMLLALVREDCEREVYHLLYR